MTTTRKPVYKLIVIEGVDGSGKTTVAKALARRLKATYLATPPPRFQPMREYIERAANLSTRYLFYLCAVSHASDLISHYLQKGHVVCDRYIGSTVACHRALGLSVEWPLSSLKLEQPDYGFLLTVSDEAERRRRLAIRKHNTSADRLFSSARLRTRLKREYAAFPLVTIDTAHRTVAQVVDEILRQTALT